MKVEIRLNERYDVSSILFIKVFDKKVQLAEFSHDDLYIFLGGVVIGLNNDELIPIACSFAGLDTDFDMFEKLNSFV